MSTNSTRHATAFFFFVKKLSSARQREVPAYREYLDAQIAGLDKALDDARIPDSYRVAVVGRFKVGKSSFINKLAQERLAAVDASPETAAISVFRYGEVTRAEIEIVPAEEWDQLRADYIANPKDAEVKRYAGFFEFNQRASKKDKDGKEIVREKADLETLASEWIKPMGQIHTVTAADWKTKEGKNAFRRELRKFTSSQEPLHYLVNKLTIYAPIPILRDHIELIDTPGLDDTERFRVHLTEELVREVDAILYLTTSGASYSGSDKEFLVRQLRRQQIKHLQVIVTKADETYDNVVRDAKDNDEDPPQFEQFRRKETSRVRGELKLTLDELLTSNDIKDDEGYYYIQQLDSIGVHLISTKLHEDGKVEQAGIDAVRDGLYSVLSTSQRFADSRRTLVERLEASLASLRTGFTDRISAIEKDYDPQKVKEEITSIKAGLSTHLDFFDGEAADLIAQLGKRQTAFRKTLSLQLEVICHMAREVIAANERDDVAAHWKSRRHRNWGYLQDLQARIADRIFPRVQANLNDLRGQFSEFLKLFGDRIDSLQTKIRTLEEDHHLSGLGTIALADMQRPVFEKLEKDFSSIAESERDVIVDHLETFVSEEVLTRLASVKDNVSRVLGSGTTVRQRGEVESFYDTVKPLLADALRTHLEKRMQDFAEAILAHAGSLAPHMREASLGLIDQRLQAIESTLAMQSTEEKQRVLAYLQEMHALVFNFAARPEATIANASKSVATPGPEDSSAPSATLSLASRQPTRYEITDGTTGFTYERLFRPYIDDAQDIVVEDPYIRRSYQFDNFARFCALALRFGCVRKIELHSYCDFGEDIDDVRARLESLRRDLKSRGVELLFNYEFRGHEREVRFDNGWRVRIGRGLDIYYPPESWVSLEASDFTLRRCKGTKIDVFRG